MTDVLYHYLIFGDSRNEHDDHPARPARQRRLSALDSAEAATGGISHDPLLSRLQSADQADARAAFEELFRATYAKLVRFAITYVGTPDSSEDVVGEVLASLWANRATLAVHGTLEGYLFGAVRRRAVSAFRHASRHTGTSVRILGADEHWGMGASAESPDASVTGGDTRAMVWRAIAELPERQRTILSLRWQGELGWDDIAHALGSTNAAVQMQHSRAIKALRARLADFIT